MKKNLIISLSIALVLVASVGVYMNFKTDENIHKANLPVEYVNADFLYNPYIQEEVVGIADYYFIAKIDEEIDTVYKDVVMLETENGYKEVGDPYTNYMVSVVENIKGNLVLDTPIPITKSGGISQDKKYIQLYEDDELLEAGNYYIISAFAQPDGSLLISGPNSNKLLETNILNKMDYEKELDVYKEYYENEIKSDRKNAVSKYDA